MDRFIITGVCPNCRALLGRLKSTSIVPLGMGTKQFPLHDPVVYHVHELMTKARIKCND